MTNELVGRFNSTATDRIAPSTELPIVGPIPVIISSTGSSQVLTSEAFVIQSDQHVESFSTLHDQDVRSCSFSRQPCGKGTAHARPDLCTKGRHCPVAAESTRAAPRSLCDLSPPHRLCSK